MNQWFVVAREPSEGDFHVNVFGPFISETDARAFALDLAADNGWEEVEAAYLTMEEASSLATAEVLWPYKDD
jgi:hypothetical protein